MFTDDELHYLDSQRLGRLATAQPGGRLQINPVGFGVNRALSTIDIGGYDMANTRKYRNVADNGRVAFVVDDVVSTEPWRVRFLEVRGHAEAVPADESGAIIRIHPTRILTMALHPDDRDVEPARLTVRSRAA